MSSPNIKPRVLIVTPGKSVFTEPFVRTFTSLGFECVVFDHRQGVVFTSPVVRGMIRAFPVFKFLKRYRVANTNRALVNLVRQFRPQYLVGQKAESIYPETVQEIHNQGVITINFYNDFINLWENIKRIAPAYDFFFSPDHYVLRELERIGVHNGYYLPFAVQSQKPDRAFQERHDRYDISFIGTYNPAVYHNRERYLTAVQDLGLHIWGSDGWADSPLKDYFHGRARGDERFDIYRTSKIVIDVNFDEWPCEAISMRPFEVGYSGACLFSDTIRADLARTFEPSMEFIPFSDARDLREKVIFYLSHENERLRIARALHENILRNHTYDVRIREMLAITSQKP